MRIAKVGDNGEMSSIPIKMITAESLQGRLERRRVASMVEGSVGGDVSKIRDIVSKYKVKD